MTNFIFCLIFIQVSIFLIAGVLLLASLVFGVIERNAGRSQARLRARPRKPVWQPEPLSRNEIEYLLGA
ncbi:MAG: hypothetical protein HDQ44_04655 [Desulfovibrio sp.]|nr:hypothetical protein [Desulfovibrio sp.]